ncbi:MAG: SMI1/KNR4 family protein [Slackia sp.]|nr:SMI1/KNR4 family protein [Slackia sp.]
MGGFVESIKEMPGFCGLKGVSERSIFEAEDVLGVSFSSDYKEYLEHLGVCSVNGHEIAGLGASERLSVVAMTKVERPNAPCVSDDWYAIERLGIDGIVAWQNAAGEVFLSAPSGRDSKKVADSLLEYLES